MPPQIWVPPAPAPHAAHPRCPPPCWCQVPVRVPPGDTPSRARVAQLGDLRSPSARQAQLLLQRERREAGSELGPKRRGVPPARDPHLPPPTAPLPCHQAVTAGSVPAHRAQGATALLHQVRVRNPPPGLSARGHLPLRSPAPVALWPGPGAMARGW